MDVISNSGVSPLFSTEDFDIGSDDAVRDSVAAMYIDVVMSTWESFDGFKGHFPAIEYGDFVEILALGAKAKAREIYLAAEGLPHAEHQMMMKRATMILLAGHVFARCSARILSEPDSLVEHSVVEAACRRAVDELIPMAIEAKLTYEMHCASCGDD